MARGGRKSFAELVGEVGDNSPVDQINGIPSRTAALADLTPEIAFIPFFSTVAEDTTAPLLDAEYWVANVRQPG